MEFLVNALSMDLHIDAVIGELTQPYVKRIIIAVWF